jgi:hypothetical protein
MVKIITREMIEGCLDDELDIMYDGWTSSTGNLSASGSEIIKKCFPDKYEEYVKEYCDRNNISIETKTVYIEHSAEDSKCAYKVNVKIIEKNTDTADQIEYELDDESKIFYTKEAAISYINDKIEDGRSVYQKENGAYGVYHDWLYNERENEATITKVYSEYYEETFIYWIEQI